MSFQFSTTGINGALDAIETVIGTAPKLRLYSGAAPANCAAAASGTLLAEITLPSDWMAAASGASKGLSGAWGPSAITTTGTCGHWRIYDTAGTTCHIQGSASATGGGGDMTFPTVSFVAGQEVSITGFTISGTSNL